MTDRDRIIEMFDKIRATFPEWGFLVGVVELDTRQIWGWSNIKDPSLVVLWLANQNPITVTKPEAN